MLISNFVIIGLPHFSNNSVSSARKFQLIDPLGEFANDFKLGISYVQPVEAFIAREFISTFTKLSKFHDDVSYCNAEILSMITKFKGQTHLNKFIFSVTIDFYSEIGITNSKEPDDDKRLDDSNKMSLYMEFFNENAYVELKYNRVVLKRISTRISRKGNVVETPICVYKEEKLKVDKKSSISPYALLKHFPLNMVYINTNDYVSIKSPIIDNSLLKSGVNRIEEVIQIMCMHDNFSMGKDAKCIIHNNHIISSFNTNSLDKCKDITKLFVSGMVYDSNKRIAAPPTYYNNLLLDYNKEFTLIFFIAVCIVYFNENDMILINHSFRHSGVGIYDITSLYGMLVPQKDELHTVLTDYAPTISLVIS